MAASRNYNTEFSADIGKSAVDCLVLEMILAGGSTGSINKLHNILQKYLMGAKNNQIQLLPPENTYHFF